MLWGVEPLIAEVWVSNVDAGFVQASQKARVKLAAYPFQKHGMLDGVMRQVKPTRRRGQIRATPPSGLPRKRPIAR